MTRAAFNFRLSVLLLSLYHLQVQAVEVTELEVDQIICHSFVDSILHLKANILCSSSQSQASIDDRTAIGALENGHELISPSSSEEKSFDGPGYRQVKLQIPWIDKIFGSPSSSSPSPSPTPAQSPTPWSLSPSQSSLSGPSLSPSASFLKPTRNQPTNHSSASPSLSLNIPQSSTVKKVVLAVAITVVMTSCLFLVLLFFYRKLRHPRKVHENPYSRPYRNPLLQTSVQSDLWKEKHNALTWTESRSKIQNPSTYRQSLSEVQRHHQSLSSKEGEHLKLNVHQELGDPQWMRPSRFHASFMHAHALDAQTATVSYPSFYPTARGSTPSVMSSACTSTLATPAHPRYRLALPLDGVPLALPKHGRSGSNSSFEGFWPSFRSITSVASSAERLPLPSSTNGMTPAGGTELVSLRDKEMDLYPVRVDTRDSELGTPKHISDLQSSLLSTKSVPPLPLPPAVVSAAFLKAQKEANEKVQLPTPVKSVTAEMDSQPLEQSLAPQPSTQLSYRPMSGLSLAASSITTASSISSKTSVSTSSSVQLPTSLQAATAYVGSSPLSAALHVKDSQLSVNQTSRMPSPTPINTPPPPPVPVGTQVSVPPPPPLPPKPSGAKTPPRPPMPPPHCGQKCPPPLPSNLGGLMAPLPARPSQGSLDERREDPLKLKPLRWEKVLADPSYSMVWDKVRAGSFDLDETGIAAYFATSNVKKAVKSSVPAAKKGLIDSRKSQNIAIQLRALNLSTPDVCDALLEGEGLKSELLKMLVKMAPTEEEQKALLGFKGDREELGPAEHFLRSLLEIPATFHRLEALQFKACFREEITEIKGSIRILEIACSQVEGSRLFLKLLEAVLKTGNHMNRGTNCGEAEAFKLDALLKLADVKSADGKTTLLHFVVEEIIKAEGLRTIRKTEGGSQTELIQEDIKRRGLEVVLGVFSELESVKRAAGIDADALRKAVLDMAHGLSSIQTRLKTSFQCQAQGDFASKDIFREKMELFCSQAEQDVAQLKQDVDRVFDQVKQTAACFHGNYREIKQPLQLLVIVRDFLFMLEKTFKDVARPLKITVRG